MNIPNVFSGHTLDSKDEAMTLAMGQGENAIVDDFVQLKFHY